MFQYIVLGNLHYVHIGSIVLYLLPPSKKMRPIYYMILECSELA